VHNARMPGQLRELHEIMLDLVGMLNEPQRDDVLIAEAGIALDRALFPLLVRVQRRGPLGIVELANLAGRDHTTVSRQVAKLEELGLVARREGKQDKRVREVVVTRKGLAMTDALDKARERLFGPRLAKWTGRDRAQLIRLMRKLVDSARE
jgi:DNA-binding MarR family transcriptional regulator